MGYQENNKTSLCEKLLQCPENLSAGYTSHIYPIKGVSVYKDQWIVSFSVDKLIIWKIQDSRIKMITSSRESTTSTIFEAKFTSDGNYLYTFSLKQILIWSIEDSYQIREIKIGDSSDLSMKQGKVKYIINSVSGTINSILAFSDISNQIAVISIIYDYEYSIYDEVISMTENMKNLPLTDDISKFEIISEQRVFGLTLSGDLLFWDTNAVDPITIAQNVVTFNLKLKFLQSFSSQSDQNVYYNGEFLVILTSYQLQIINATNIGQQMTTYIQPYQNSLQMLNFYAYAINDYLNEVYLLDGFDIYVYNLITAEFKLKNTHNLSFILDIPSTQIYNSGQYLLISLKNQTSIFKRTDTGIKSSDPTHEYSDQFQMIGILSNYQSLRVYGTQSLIWTFINQEIIAKTLVVDTNNNTIIKDVFSIKNIAFPGVVAPKDAVKPQILVSFEEFYAISFPSSIYVWSYKDHTLLYTIEFSQPGNNFLIKLEQNILIVFRDLSCQQLTLLCQSSIKVYQLGINFAQQISIIQALNTDYYAVKSTFYNSSIYVITSSGNMYQFTLDSSYQLVNTTSYYSTQNSTLQNYNRISQFSNNLILNIYSDQGIFELINLDQINNPSILYIVDSNIPVDSFLISSKQNSLTVVLTNNTNLILLYSVTGFSVVSFLEGFIEQILVSTYSLRLGRIVLVERTQMLIYSLLTKTVLSKQQTSIYFQIVEYVTHITSKDIEILAFLVNRQMVVVFDVVSYRIICQQEFSRINQLSFMKFNYNNNIMHFVWENKTHSHTQIENPYSQKLFNNRTQFDQSGMTDAQLQLFHEDQYFFDQNDGILVKIDYQNTMILVLEVFKEEIIYFQTIDFLFQDCVFVPSQNLLILQNTITDYIYTIYYLEGEPPQLTDFQIDTGYSYYFGSQSSIQMVISRDQNYLLFINKYDLMQVDLRTIELIAQTNLSDYFTGYSSVELTLYNNFIQLTGFTQMNISGSKINQYLLLYDIYIYEVYKFSIYKQFLHIIVNNKIKTDQIFIGITNNEISVNSLSRNNLLFNYTIDSFQSFKLHSNHFVIIANTSGLIMDLTSCIPIDKWTDEQDIVQKAIYVSELQLVIKKKQSCIYISEAYTGKVKFVLPIQKIYIDFIYLHKNSMIAIQLPKKIDFVELDELRQVQSIFCTSKNETRMIYTEYSNTFLMIDKSQMVMDLISYDNDSIDKWTPASNNEKQIYVKSDSSVYLSDNDFNVWKFDSFDYFQRNVYKSPGVIQNLFEFNDQLVIMANNQIQVYSHENNTLLNQLPINQDEMLFQYTSNNQNNIFFVGRQSIRQITQLSGNLTLTTKINSSDLTQSIMGLNSNPAIITAFSYSNQIQTIIFADSFGRVFMGNIIKTKVELTSSETIKKLKYLDSIDCLLISTNYRIILQDFSSKRKPNQISISFDQLKIETFKVFNDTQVLVIMNIKSAKLEIREINDPTSATNSTVIDMQIIKYFLNPTYLQSATKGDILNEQYIALYTLYSLNLYDNIKNRFVYQLKTQTPIQRILYKDNLLFISTNSTFNILCIIEQFEIITYSGIKVAFPLKQLQIQQSVILSMNLTFYQDYFYMNALFKYPFGIQSVKFNLKNTVGLISYNYTYDPFSQFNETDFFEYNKNLSFCYITVNSDQKLYQIYQSISNTKKIIDFYSPTKQNAIQIFYEIGQPLPYILTQFVDSQYQIKFIPTEKTIINLSFVTYYKSSILSIKGFTVLLRGMEYCLYPISASITSVQFEDVSFVREINSDAERDNFPIIKFSGQKDIVFNNVKIEDQYLGLEYFLSFTNAQTLLLQNITVSRSTLVNITLFNIYKIDTVVIQNIEFVDNVLVDISSFFLIQNVRSLEINNITIRNTRQREGYFSILDLQTYKIQYNLLMINLVNILGVQSTEIYIGLIENNKDTQFLSYSNTYDQEDSVITLKYEFLRITNVTLIGNYNSQSFLALIEIQSAYCIVSNSQFINNYCPMCFRGSSLFISYSDLIYLSNVIMSDNVGLMGGALYVYETDRINILNSDFNLNKALSFGGALYLDTFNSINFTNTSITLNVADIGGGIYYNSFYHRNFPNVDVTNNQANIYGNNIGSFPQKINIVSQSDNANQGNNTLNRILKFKEGFIDFLQNNKSQNISDPESMRQLQEGDLSQIEISQYVNSTFTINNFRSGDFLNLSLQLLDEEGKEIYLQKAKQYYNEQSIKLLSTFFVIAVPEEENTIKVSGISQIGIDSASAADSYWQFKDLKIIGHPSQQQRKFRIIMGQIKQYDMYNYLESKKFLITDFPSYEIEVTINFRPCIQGEIYNCDDDNQYCTCTPCQQGLYSLQVYNDSKTRQFCELCPESAFLCQKDQIFLKQGYWRISNQTDNIVQCSNEPSNCKGDSQKQTFSGNEICVEGHIGPLCEVCDTYGIYWGQTYMRQNEFKCTPCKDLHTFVSVLPFIFIFLAMVFYIIFSIRVTIQLSKGYIYSYYFRKLGMVHIGLSNTKNGAQFYVKQFMHYLQIAGIVNSYNFDVPYVTDYLPELLSSPIRNTIYSFDCLFANIGNHIPIVYLRSAWSLIIPFFYAITICIIYLSIYIMKGKKKSNKFFIYNGLLFMLVLFQPGIVSSLFQVLSCREIAGTFYISADIAYECYTNQHLKFILILMLPGIMLWGIVIPGFILYSIYKNKNRLEEYNVRLKFGFLYDDYNRRYCYWEFIKIYLKFIIMIISNMFDELFYTKQIIICFLIACYLIFCLKKQPYLVKNYNVLDQRVSIALFILTLVNMFLYSRESDLFYNIFFYICVSMHNAMLFFLFFKFLVTKIKTRYKTFIYKLFLHLKKLLPLLFSFIKLQPPINCIRSTANWRKVQIAKDIIISHRKMGQHIQSIEQIRIPYQLQILYLQHGILNVITSSKTSKRSIISNNLDFGQSPKVSMSAKKHKKQVNQQILSPTSLQQIPQVNEQYIMNSDNKIVKKKSHKSSKKNSASAHPPPYRSSLASSQQRSTEVNSYLNQINLKSSDQNHLTIPFSFESPSSINLQQQSMNPYSSHKLEEINSQTQLQKHSSNQSISGNQFSIINLQGLKGKESSSGISSSQLLMMHNSSIYNGNPMQRSIYQYSAQNLQEESNFNSRQNLSPNRIKENFNFNESVQVPKVISSNFSQVKVDSEYVQDNLSLYNSSSSSSQGEVTSSHLSSSSSSQLSSNTSPSSSFVNHEQFVASILNHGQLSNSQHQTGIKSRSLTNLTNMKQGVEIELQSLAQSPKTLPSPRFQFKDYTSQPSLGLGTRINTNASNQEQIDSTTIQPNNSQKRDSKNLPYRFPTNSSIKKQVRQDSFFSFKSPDISQATQQNRVSQSSSQLKSPQKLLSQSTFKFNLDNQQQQQLKIKDQLENSNNIYLTSDESDRIIDTNFIRGRESVKSLPNQPNQTVEAKNSIQNIKKQTSLQSPLSIIKDKISQSEERLDTDSNYKKNHKNIN